MFNCVPCVRYPQASSITETNVTEPVQEADFYYLQLWDDWRLQVFELSPITTNGSRVSMTASPS